MKEHEYIKITDRVHISSAIEQLRKIRFSDSVSGLNKQDLTDIITKLREWEEELFRIVDVEPDQQ